MLHVMTFFSSFFFFRSPVRKRDRWDESAAVTGRGKIDEDETQDEMQLCCSKHTKADTKTYDGHKKLVDYQPIIICDLCVGEEQCLCHIFISRSVFCSISGTDISLGIQRPRLHSR